MRRPVRQLHLLYHELRSATAAYSYVTSTDLFRQHVDVCASLLANQSEVAPVITFDDGHVSNSELAAPILKSRGISAHFFITVGWVASRPGYMEWSQLRALCQAGNAIGAHGWSHKLLTHCSESELENELVRSRSTLEEKIGTSVTTMSLPGGRFNHRVLDACKAAGYTRVYTSVPRSEAPPFGYTIGRMNILGDMHSERLALLFTPSSPQLARITRGYRIKAVARSLIGDRLYERLWALANRQEPEADDSRAGTDPASRQEPSA